MKLIEVSLSSLRTLRSLLNTLISPNFHILKTSTFLLHLADWPADKCALSPGDELGLLAQSPLEVLPGCGHVSSVLLHVLSVAVVEAADELQQGDGSVLVNVQPVKDLIRLGCGHLQLRADGQKLVSLDPPRVVHVVGVKERPQPVLLLCAHALDGGMWHAGGEKRRRFNK